MASAMGSESENVSALKARETRSQFTIRANFQSASLSPVDPGLKPWALLYRPFRPASEELNQDLGARAWRRALATGAVALQFTHANDWHRPSNCTRQ